MFLIQKHVVRAITNAPFRVHTAPLFAQLNLLDIYKLNFFHIAKFMFVCFFYTHRLLPSSFLRLVTRSSDFHKYHIRTASNYRPHFCLWLIHRFQNKIWLSRPRAFCRLQMWKQHLQYCRVFVLKNQFEVRRSVLILESSKPYWLVSGITNKSLTSERERNWCQRGFPACSLFLFCFKMTAYFA